jgi:hypothetical protein
LYISGFPIITEADSSFAQSADSRFAACRTLSNLSPCIAEEPIDSATRIRYHFLVKQALSDDDIDIRNLAAQVVCNCVGRRHPCCRDFAVEEWWSFMSKQFGRESAWHNALVDRLNDGAAVGEFAVDAVKSRF